MPRGRPSAKVKPQWALALASRRAALGLTQDDIADRTEGVLGQKNVSDFENARVDIRDTTVTRVAALARALEWTLFDLQDALGVNLGLGQNPASTVMPLAVHTVPSYPMGAALNPSLPPHAYSVMLGMRRDGRAHPKTLKAFVMDSDEMTVPGQRSLHPGDYVVVNLEDHELKAGDMYMVTRNGKAHVRRYKETEMGNGFYADNVSYDPLPMNGTQLIGRVYRLSSPDRAPATMN